MGPRREHGDHGWLRSSGVRRRYGLDGGAVAVPLFGVTGAALTGALAWALRHRRPGAAWLAGLGGLVVAGSAGSYLYSSGQGKLSLWAGLLDGLGLHGDERALDIGCGRGAVLMLAAKRIPNGLAVGADLWRRRDQSGNSSAAAQRNAVAEGVQGRVRLVETDARRLALRAASFDIVVSNLTFHNLRAAEEREQALRELVRVLRAGGRLVVVDFGAHRYGDVLSDAGCLGVSVRELDWRTWFGVPGHHLHLVEARKPTGPGADHDLNG